MYLLQTFHFYDYYNFFYNFFYNYYNRWDTQQLEDRRREQLGEDRRRKRLGDNRREQLNEDQGLQKLEGRRVEAVVDVSGREQEEQAMKEAKEESILEHLREDTARVLTMLQDLAGPPQQWEEVYAYLEAHLHDPDRVQVVAAEFRGMVESMPREAGVAESRPKEVASPQALQPNLETSVVTKGSERGKGGKRKGAQRRERRGEVEEETLSKKPTSQSSSPFTCAPDTDPVNLSLSSSRPAQGAATETSVKQPPPAEDISSTKKKEISHRGGEEEQEVEMVALHTEELRASPPPNHRKELVPPISEHSLSSPCTSAPAAAPEPVNLSVSSSRPAQRAATETSVAVKQPPTAEAMGEERRSSRTGRGRRYQEFIKDISSTKKKVTEQGDVKKRRRSGCGACKGCSAQDCQVCRH